MLDYELRSGLFALVDRFNAQSKRLLAAGLDRWDQERQEREAYARRSEPKTPPPPSPKGVIRYARTESLFFFFDATMGNMSSEPARFNLHVYGSRAHEPAAPLIGGGSFSRRPIEDEENQQPMFYRQLVQNGRAVPPQHQLRSVEVTRVIPTKNTSAKSAKTKPDIMNGTANGATNHHLFSTSATVAPSVIAPKGKASRPRENRTNRAKSMNASERRRFNLGS